MIKKIFTIAIIGLFILSAFQTISIKGMKINIDSNKKINEQNEVVKESQLFIPGELIVKFKSDININNDNNLIGPTGIKSVDILNKKYSIKSAGKIFTNSKISTLKNTYKLTLSENNNLQNIADVYSNDPNVEFAEPNYIYRLCNTPNDQYYNMQWALNQSNDADVDAPEAWDIETGSSDIIIAIVDSGVDYNHPDLAANIWHNDDEIIDGNDTDKNAFIDDTIGWDFFFKDNDPMDNNGHGTHCAGIASAVTNNEIGVAGISWNCKIMPLKVFGKEGKGSLENAATAICYAMENGAQVISMSFGAPLDSKLLQILIQLAYNQGIILVGSAGNDDKNSKFYPAYYEEVIAVGATDNYDNKAYFSNYGNWVDVSAPGVNILSLRANGTNIYGDDSYIVGENYYIASGTSMAGPYVAGLAGLLLSFDIDQNPGNIKSRIVNSADRIRPSYNIGRGRINAYEALLRGPGPAESKISFPVHLSEVKGVIEIKGSASGEGFQYFSVEYAKGKNPDEGSFIEILNSTEEVNNSLFCELDTALLFEGIYSIRLKVICDNGQYKDTVKVIVNNMKNTYYVDDDGGVDYTKIKEAILECGSGDTVFVYNGTYQDNIKIFTSITLTGEDNRNTSISPENTSYDIIYVNANWVNISGFAINGSYTCGILLENSDNCDIRCNFITSCWPGLKLIGSSYNTIAYNKFKRNFIGVRVTDKSNKNKLTHNNFIFGILHRLMCEHATYKHSYFNKWNQNYWDNHIAAKIKLLRFIPKKIPFRLWDISNVPFFKIPRLRANYDWRPATEPFEIPPNGLYEMTGGI